MPCYWLKGTVTTPLPSSVSREIGDPDSIYAGTVRFQYGSYYGPLHWINSVNFVLFPEYPKICTGWTYLLKPGVQVTFYASELLIDGSTGFNIGTGLVGPILGKLPP